MEKLNNVKINGTVDGQFAVTSTGLKVDGNFTGTIEGYEKVEKTVSKAQERLNALAEQGFDTSSYVLISSPSGTEKLMQWSGSDLIESNSNNEIYKKIMCEGWVKNSHLWRRFVTAQTFKIMRDNSSYENYLRKTGWKYQWKTLIHELRVLGAMQRDDDPELNRRGRFMNSQIVADFVNSYERALIRGWNSKEPHFYRHTTQVWKSIYGHKFFYDELAVYVSELFKDSSFEDCLIKYGYFGTATKLEELFKKVYRVQADNHFISPKFAEWYKAIGAYYTLDNLIKFHDVKIYDDAGLLLTREGSLQLLESKTNASIANRKTYRIMGLLKETVGKNDFYFFERMKEIYNK